jgi:hypothetical protein
MIKETTLAFKNLGDLRFSRHERPWGLDRTGVSLGAATADFDNDGDLDLVVSNVDAPVTVYRNHSANSHAALVRLHGTSSNRYGLGTTLRVRAGQLEQVQYVSMTRGWLSSNDPVGHFGLGASPKLDELVVEWPSGHRQSFTDLDANFAYTITEPIGPVPSPGAEELPSTLFTRSENMPVVKHQENEFDDFARQPLLPNRLSLSGPALASADIDRDRDVDFFVGGGRGQPGRILLNDSGTLRALDLAVFSDARDQEAACAVFLDADGDQDQDLWVVFGSVEEEPGSEFYRDRLYLNDGQGKFSASDLLPDDRDSGSVAALCDFDKDGDWDAFVGSRSVPGQYPLPPKSRLLVNDQGRYSDKTPSVLSDCGLVTDAVWVDLDGDDWSDLVVATDWGPIKIFLNRSGQLTDATVGSGLESRLGWWTCLAAADVDADGDMDLVAGNFGQNTKYHPTTEKPELLYYGTFDDSGKSQIIEAKFDGAICVPRRGFSCSRTAMPFLKDKLQTFHNFAKSSLIDIYGENKLNSALQLSANTLDSALLINDGRGHFEFLPLPRLAQVAPCMDLALQDFNGDGHIDIFLLQNFFGPQRETGRMDGGLSLLLLGDGTANFQPIPPGESGVVLPVDARKVLSVDLNGDGSHDLLIGVNNGPLIALENQATHPGHQSLTHVNR